MCSISGFIGKPISRSDLRRLHAAILVESSVRGDQATGFAIHAAQGTTVSKLPVSPELFVEHDRFYHNAMATIELLAPVSCISHTRLATHGDTLENINNHPHYIKDRLYLVHNGVLNDPDDESKVWDVIESDCDSEYLLRAVQLYGYTKGIRKIIEWGGTFAVIFMNKDGDLIFTRDDRNPMFVIDLRDTFGVFFITSTEEIFSKAYLAAMKQEMPKEEILKRKVIIPDYSVWKMPLATLEMKEIVRYTVMKKPTPEPEYDEYLLKYFHRDEPEQSQYDAHDVFGKEMLNKV